MGRGEQGVLLVEPYKSEILPHWRFRTPAIARESAEKIMALFEEYRQQDDFVGMDMARKFIQMGFTRARRYANHPGGKNMMPSVRCCRSSLTRKRWNRQRSSRRTGIKSAQTPIICGVKAHQQRYG